VFSFCVLLQVLKKLPSYLKMSLVVTDEYIEGFIKADNTFLYQLTFDPLTRKLCPLNPYPPEVNAEEMKYAGRHFSNERAYQIALGNLDIHNMEKIGDFDPKTYVVRMLSLYLFISSFVWACVGLCYNDLYLI
jgi:exonuclease-1